MGRERKRTAWWKRINSCKAMQSLPSVWTEALSCSKQEVAPTQKLLCARTWCLLRQPDCLETAWQYLSLSDWPEASELSEPQVKSVQILQSLKDFVSDSRNPSKTWVKTPARMHRILFLRNKFFCWLWTLDQCFCILLGTKELLRLEGIFGADLIQPPAQAEPTRRHLPRISPDGFEYVQGWTHILGQPQPVFSHLHSKKCFLSHSEGTSWVSVCSSIIFCPVTGQSLKRAWLHLLFPLLWGICTHWCNLPVPLQPSLLQNKELSQPFLTWEMFYPVHTT